jgi:hypothetical protein
MVIDFYGCVFVCPIIMTKVVCGYTSFTNDSIIDVM